MIDSFLGGLAFLACLDFSYFLIAARVCDGSLTCQSFFGFCRGVIGLVLLRPETPVWRSAFSFSATLSLVASVGLIILSQERLVVRKVLRRGLLHFVAVVLLAPAQEEIFFRYLLLSLPAHQPLLVLISCVWFVADHDFREPWGRFARSLAYSFLALHFSPVSSFFAHALVNLSLY